jgi:ribosomal protein S6
MPDKKHEYQLVVILDPHTDEKASEVIWAKLMPKFEVLGADAEKEHIGPKDLVYKIKKNSKGDFWAWKLKSKMPIKMNEFNTILNREPKVIRYLMLKK